ncbi:hypothetical protein ACHAWF_006177, partial [Thalassiosira exigua]
LWNARIHPILETNGSSEKDYGDDGGALDFSFLTWIAALRRDEEEDGAKGGEVASLPAAMRGLRRWKDARRLSLAQVRNAVDPEAEERYDTGVRSSDLPRIWEKRRLTESRTSSRVAGTSPATSTVHCIRRGTRAAFGASPALMAVPRRPDVAGRAFMTMAALLFDVARVRGNVPSEGVPPGAGDPAGRGQGGARGEGGGWESCTLEEPARDAWRSAKRARRTSAERVHALIVY